jgi:hypothetical protein
VDTDVQITVMPDGSGDVTVTVTADADVVKQAPGLAEDFAASDLTASGWEVEGPTPASDGGLRVVLRHPFDSIAEANAVLAQLSASNGPLQQLTVGVSGTTGQVQWTFGGRLDLSRGLEAFADEDLVTAVGATPWLGVVKEQKLTEAEVASLSVRVSLPGARQADGGGTLAPGAATWSANPGDPAVQMSSRTLATSLEVKDAKDLQDRMVKLLMAYGALVAVGVVVWLLLRARRRRRIERRRLERQARQRADLPR